VASLPCGESGWNDPSARLRDENHHRLRCGEKRLDLPVTATHPGVIPAQAGIQ
jgi:hypothetical protein